MQDNEIETELKNKAEQINIKGFSKRWKKIKERGIIEEPQQQILADQSVLSTNNGTLISNNRKRNIIFIFCSFIIVCMIITAIILPILLKKKETFYFWKDLEFTPITETQFFNSIDNARYEIVNLSEFGVSTYVIITLEDKTIKGGSVGIENEGEEYVLEITFFDKTVELKELDLNYNTCEINETEINFNTEFEEGVYSTYAYAEFKNLYYQINYISIEDNLIEVLEKLFS